MKSLVTDHDILEEDYSICLNPECAVIYFAEKSVYDKNNIPVKVWFKEKTSHVPVCYCKNITKQDIFDHILVHKCCTTLQDIQNHTGANTGKECLTQNPTGK